MRYLLTLFLLVFVVSCDEGAAKIPTGYEHVSKDRRSHFIYVKPDKIGEKVNQREAGRIICTEVFQESDYCEVYYFSRKEEVPTKFPIMNRIRPIGYYEIKNGKEKFKVLTES